MGRRRCGKRLGCTDGSARVSSRAERPLRRRSHLIACRPSSWFAVARALRKYGRPQLNCARTAPQLVLRADERHHGAASLRPARTRVCAPCARGSSAAPAPALPLPPVPVPVHELLPSDPRSSRMGVGHGRQRRCDREWRQRQRERQQKRRQRERQQERERQRERERCLGEVCYGVNTTTNCVLVR